METPTLRGQLLDQLLDQLLEEQSSPLLVDLHSPGQQTLSAILFLLR